MHILKKTIVSFTLNKNLVQTFHTSREFYATYKQAENEIAHKVLENNEGYCKTVVRHPTLSRLQKDPDVDSKSLYGAFYKATVQSVEEGLELNDPKFSDLVQKLTKNFRMATCREIIHTLYCLSFWPKISLEHEDCRIMLKALDNVCLNRLNRWTTTEKLLVADYWFHLQWGRNIRYNLNMIRDLVSKKETLTPCEVVELLFFISIQRDVPQALLTKLEAVLYKIVHVISIEEINIVCLGYFKNECIIRNQNLLRAILSRTAAGMKETDCSNMTGILKCVRKSFKPHIIGCYQTFMEACSSNCFGWNLYALIHASLLTSACMIFEVPILENAMKKLERNLSGARLKDICKLLQCLTSFNYCPDSRFNSLLFDEVLSDKRHEEVFMHPRDFVYIAVFYSYVGLYNYDNLSKIMTPEFIARYSKSERKHFAFLDYCIDIECQDYVGPRMQTSLRSLIISKLQEDPYIKEDGILLKAIQRVKDRLEELEGMTQNYSVNHILPHLATPDIILRLNAKPDALPLSDILKNHSQCDILRPPPDETWACLVMCGFFSYAYNSDRISGLVALKERQLTKLGYKVLLLNTMKLPTGLSEQLKFLKAKLSKLQSYPLMSAVV